jgi:hypothetical protein
VERGAFAEIERREFVRFEPHFAWKGHTEYEV